MRHRNMFYATGLPGWMRFGYSPGWGGPGPCAQYLMSGQWPTPQMAAAWQAMQAGMPGPALDPSAQVEMLKSQAEMLEGQLQQIREAITQLEGQQTSEE
jgi:hypothetical protein